MSSRKRSRGANYSGLSRANTKAAFSSNVDVQQNRKIRTLQTAVAKLTKGDEVKYLDRVFTYSASTSGLVIPLNDMQLFAGTQSVRHEQREGQSVVSTQLLAKGTVYIDQTATSPDENNRVRVMVVLTKDSTTPVIGDILQSVNINSYNKIKPPHDYSVLWDKTFNLQCPAQQIPSAFNSTSTVSATEKWRIPFNIKLGAKELGKTGCKATWLTTDGAVAPRTGALSIIVLSDSAVISHPVVQGYSRYRFIDN